MGDTPQHWTAYVNAWSTFAAAIAAVTVAIFAFLEMWRSRAEAKARKEATDEYVSTEAYQLRRELMSHFSYGEIEGMPPGYRIEWCDEFRAAGDQLEGRLVFLVQHAAGASASVNAAVKAALLRYHQAIDYAAGFESWRKLPSGDAAGDMGRYYAGISNEALRLSIKALDGAIDPRFQEEDIPYKLPPLEPE